jgi:hypothetical protein
VIPFNYTRSAEDGHREKLRYLPSGDTVVAVTVENPNSSPIPVYLTNPGSAGGEVKSLFGMALGVATATETLIINYVVPLGKTADLIKCEFSGTNIGTYNIYLNSVLIAVYRTYFNGPMSDQVQFACESISGLPLVAGDTIELKVYNFRPGAGDFDGRIQVLEE